MVFLIWSVMCVCVWVSVCGCMCVCLCEGMCVVSLEDNETVSQCQRLLKFKYHPCWLYTIFEAISHFQIGPSVRHTFFQISFCKNHQDKNGPKFKNLLIISLRLNYCYSSIFKGAGRVIGLFWNFGVFFRTPPPRKFSI